MTLEPLFIVMLAILGLSTGFLAGLLGVGGGMMMVPFITIILTGRGVDANLAVKMAIATSMSTIMFTSISSVRAHHKRGLVRWDLVKRLAPGIVLGGAVASMGIFSVLKGSWLALFFSAFVVCGWASHIESMQMIRHRPHEGDRGDDESIIDSRAPSAA